MISDCSPDPRTLSSSDVSSGCRVSERQGIIQWIYLLIGFVFITLVFYLFSFFVNDEVDWWLLRLLNPDTPVPVLDDFMILVTDFSMPLFGWIFVLMEIGCWLSGHVRPDKIRVAFNGVGILFSIIIGSAFFWAGYEHRFIFFPLALIHLGAVRMVIRTITCCDEETLRQVNRLFGLTLLAVLLTQASVEIIKALVARPRPLEGVPIIHGMGIRLVADEVVRSGFSYVAGHSAIFSAMVVPLAYFLSDQRFKAGLWLWVLIHAFTRVYLAAHFPFCSLMGVMLGFSVATLTVKLFDMYQAGEVWKKSETGFGTAFPVPFPCYLRRSGDNLIAGKGGIPCSPSRSSR